MRLVEKNLRQAALAAVTGCAVLCGCGANKPNARNAFPLPRAAEESSVYLEPCSAVRDDFIRGMDASAVLSVERSGAKYYGFDGTEQDVFKTLAEGGVNCVRFRVWNDPYDENGNGYGGGNCDIDAAAEMGKRATQYGMGVLIDFHYSDFWADPKRQHAPKAWKGMKIDEKCAALYEFTKDSLNRLLDAGVNVTMVQVGNEINNGMSGETGFVNVSRLLKEGSRAVREVAKSRRRKIDVALHYTHIDQESYAGEIQKIMMALKNYEVDYDVMGLSYYPFWDGTTANMQSVVKTLREEYGKKVMIAETSYPFTSEDGDGFGNAFGGGEAEVVPGYPATVQGQARAVRDVCAAAAEAGAIGVFYWEGTWIPVGKPSENNSAKWEKYGSGWASSFCADYDPDDGALYYGGGSWDNQAMFDFDGHPLESLKTWRCLRYGTKSAVKVDYIPAARIECEVGSPFEMPETVAAIMSDGKTAQKAAEWNAADVREIDTERAGVHRVSGTLEDGTAVSCQVEVKNINYAGNAGFEDADTSMWTITAQGENPTDFQKKEIDAHSGKVALHFYSAQAMDFVVEQTLTGLADGVYEVAVFAQGGDVSKDSVLELFAVSGGAEQTAGFMLTVWADWQNPKIPAVRVTDGTLRFGVRMKCGARGWGTVDDFTVFKVE